MDEQLLSFLALAGVALLLVAAFATDWRAGLVVLGLSLIVFAVRLEAGAAGEVEE